MNKQSEIIKILSKKLSDMTDCPEAEEPGFCIYEECCLIDEEYYKCWVRWAAEQIKGDLYDRNGQRRED